jgi:hypothetical protein
MRKTLFFLALLTSAGCTATPAPQSDYLFVWAGDSAEKSSDFLAVIDANPASPQYGSVITSLPTGVHGTHPHHTEAELSANGHLLANGFHTGTSWLFDLTTPRAPKIITTFGDLAGYSHPHTYLRLSNGHVLATFQYKADSMGPAPMHMAGMSMGTVEHPTEVSSRWTRRGPSFAAEAPRTPPFPTGAYFRTASWRCRRSTAPCRRPPTWTARTRGRRRSGYSSGASPT